MLSLDVLEGQLDLVLADPFRATAELRAAQDRDDMIEALGMRSQSLYLGREKLTFLRQTFALGIEPGILGSCRQDHRLQRHRRANRAATASCTTNRRFASGPPWQLYQHVWITASLWVA
jgi:hypothetical protein